MNRLRQHQPVRPDKLAELWDAWLLAHDDDLPAALGALLARDIDEGSA